MRVQRAGNGAGGGPADTQFLRFIDVKKSYDHRTLVVKGFNLDVAKGEFVTLLGPSGSGKTTILLLLAGFESVTGGEIWMDGVPITKVAPYKRNIGMVFQNYALFPHMTVAENLAYPLKIRNFGREAAAARVEEYLELVELGGFGNRRPGQLSGGQRQRVALARALIFEPSVVLMDEPLGALDRKLREQMQFEISRLHRQLGFTVIYVTHDQTEALTMSNRVAVFDDGVVQQCAAPDTLYERPANAFVADFIGENNFIPGQLATLAEAMVAVTVAGGQQINARAGDLADVGANCIVSVRPEKISIAVDDGGSGAGAGGADASRGAGNDTGGPDNQVLATFTVRHYVGDFVRYYYELADGTEVTVKVLNDVTAPDPERGERSLLKWHSADCFAFPAAGQDFPGSPGCTPTGAPRRAGARSVPPD